MGAVLEIDPFDEPNVSESKEKTKGSPLRRHLAAAGAGAAIAGPPLFASERTRKCCGRRGHAGQRGRRRRPQVGSPRISRSGSGDYVAFKPLPPDDAWRRICTASRAKSGTPTRLACTMGFGRRLLHSTGQLHKGGPTTASSCRSPATAERTCHPGCGLVPDAVRGAGAGDLEVLQAHGRRARSDPRRGGSRRAQGDRSAAPGGQAALQKVGGIPCSSRCWSGQDGRQHGAAAAEGRAQGVVYDVDPRRAAELAALGAARPPPRRGDRGAQASPGLLDDGAGRKDHRRADHFAGRPPAAGRHHPSTAGTRSTRIRSGARKSWPSGASTTATPAPAAASGPEERVLPDGGRRSGGVCGHRADLRSLRPGGLMHTGPAGSGHYVKMVHNGIESA